jgi:NADH:ubiquinone oxidoreductase subunit 2 (subunit N)
VICTNGFYAAVLQRQIALVVLGVITVGCGFYYYLKVATQQNAQPERISGSALTGFGDPGLQLSVINHVYQLLPLLRGGPEK